MIAGVLVEIGQMVSLKYLSYNSLFAPVLRRAIVAENG
jgi:hypothetical protein